MTRSLSNFVGGGATDPLAVDDNQALVQINIARSGGIVVSGGDLNAPIKAALAWASLGTTLLNVAQIEAATGFERSELVAAALEFNVQLREDVGGLPPEPYGDMLVRHLQQETFLLFTPDALAGYGAQRSAFLFSQGGRRIPPVAFGDDFPNAEIAIADVAVGVQFLAAEATNWAINVSGSFVFRRRN